jgi:hypothetical protein
VPRSGSDLPTIKADKIAVTEAAPDPPPGPIRDQLVAANEARARAAQDALTAVLQAYLDRAHAVITARLRGPKARKGTRWWSVEIKSVDRPQGIEHKALDPHYVVPDKIVGGLADDVRPVALRIATDAATDTAERLGDDGGLSDFDMDDIAQAVDDVVSRLLGVADRHASEIRQAVLDADKDAGDLDEVLDRIEDAYRRGGNWLLMSGRTLANALINDAAYREAVRCGVTHLQWVSRRDERVRATHVIADGQVRRTGDKFTVGGFRLQHPGDPTDLPESWREIANCRCGMRFRRPTPQVRALLKATDEQQKDPQAAASHATTILTGAVAASAGTATGETLIPTPDGYGLPPVASVVAVGEPVVGYRVLDHALQVVPGQEIALPSALVLGLATPATATAVVLMVVIPAGVAIGYAAGAVILPEGMVLEVLGAGAEGVRAQVKQQ